MLKQVEVQPRPNEYPHKLLVVLYLPVKTDIDTSKSIAEKVRFYSCALLYGEVFRGAFVWRNRFKPTWQLQERSGLISGKLVANLELSIVFSTVVNGWITQTIGLRVPIHSLKLIKHRFAAW